MKNKTPAKRSQRPIKRKSPPERVAEALEEIVREFRSIAVRAEAIEDSLDAMRRDLWSLELAVRGEPREET